MHTRNAKALLTRVARFTSTDPIEQVCYFEICRDVPVNVAQGTVGRMVSVALDLLNEPDMRRDWVLASGLTIAAQGDNV